MKRNTRSLIVAFIIIFFGLSVWLACGNIDHAEQVEQPGDDTSGRPVDKTEYNLYYIELVHPLNESERAELQERVDWIGEYDGHSIPVRAGEDSAMDLKNLPFVQDVSIYETSRKVTGDLKTGSSANSSDSAGRLEVVITLVESKDKPAAVELIENLGGRVTGGKDEHDQYLVVEVPSDVVDRLAASPLVLFLEKNSKPEFLNDRARDITGATPLALPDFFTANGLTGRGVMVGLADSGLDTGELGNLHPDLRNEPGRSPRVVMLQSLAGAENPADKVGHGTHMAGTIVGSGASSGGKYAGIAPGATLYFQGIVDGDNNPAPPLDLFRLFLPAYEAGVRVHVNGWGRDNNLYASSSAQIDSFVRRYPDFLPVFGAGNEGPGSGTLTKEANSKNALVVGASRSPRPSFDNDTGTTLETAEFSSRGPASGGRIKPDLLAPGSSIISTCSSLIEGNLPGRTGYTRMQGTSMAAAVAGGAAALIHEYFQSRAGYGEPSAALIKAALINGARHIEGDRQEVGFGLLDIGSTVLALEKGMFAYSEDKKGIKNGGTSTFEFEVAVPDAPVKVTLAWTDPPATPGADSALVNNLDLVVTDPEGKRYLGNDHSGSGKPDAVNNVEQVVIDKPVVGKYRVEVVGKSIKGLGSPSKSVPGQDFALVYGQQPAREVLAGVEKEFFILETGDLVDRPDNLLVALNGKMIQQEPLPGSDLYFTYSPGGTVQAFAVGESWRALGIKVLVSEAGPLLTRINRNYREGGFYVDEYRGNMVEFNGEVIENAAGIPPGSSALATVNPLKQTLWSVKATSREKEGVVGKCDAGRMEIQLLGMDEPYRIAPEAALVFNDSVTTGDPADMPFGAPVNPRYENVLPGMPVKMALGGDGTVYHLAVQRQVFVGTVSSIDATRAKVTLSSGKSYTLLDGAAVKRDDNASSLAEIETGDLVMGLLVPESNKVLALDAYSRAVYGRVVFAGNNSLYITDDRNTSHTFKIAKEAAIYRWGLFADASILAPEQWVRLVLDPGTGEVKRADIAEVMFEARETIGAVNLAAGNISTSSGLECAISGRMVVTKNGYKVLPGDLKPGERADLTVLSGVDGSRVLADIRAYNDKPTEEIKLSVNNTIPFESFYLLRGRTTAEKLYAWHADGSFNRVELTGEGEFFYPVYYPNYGGVQLVGVNGNGAVTGLRVKLPEQRNWSFVDINGHWAEEAIRNLASRGLLSGYGDRTFRPDRDVSRVEFAAMFARLFGKHAGVGTELEFRDADLVPSWAVQSLRVVTGYGLISGYDDNTFRPHEPISRAEAASILVRAAGILGIQVKTAKDVVAYRDEKNIPIWAKQDVSLAGQLGLLVGKPGNLFKPTDNMTRAEAAVIMHRLLDLTVENNKDAMALN